MFQWRLKLREARQALSAGRVDEAGNLLQDQELRDFLPAKKLAGQVAERFTQRARQRIAWGESAAGFQDLAVSERLAGMLPAAEEVRHDYANSAAQQAAERLVAADPDAAIRRVERAKARGVSDDSLRGLTEIAQLWVESRGLAQAGEMGSAKSRLETARRLAETFEKGQSSGLAGAVRGVFGRSTMALASSIAREAKELDERAEKHHAARERLHAAAADKKWDEALTAVEETLHLAPADPVARSLRRRLWNEVGLGLTSTQRGQRRRAPLAMKQEKPIDDSLAATRNRKLGLSLRASTQPSSGPTGDTSAGAPRSDRRMLWMDAVGGFLMCFDEEVLIGQPVAGQGEGGPAIPILADISRRHAVLRREGGAYVLDPLGPVRLDGETISGPTVLGDRHEIQLGTAVRLRFVRPHALSATARLEIVSGHRTSPSADAVLLMAESCVLGPGAHSHIRCRDWQRDVILFRQGEQLLCRSTEAMEVNGQATTGPAPISPGSRVEGEDFALSVEEA